MKKFIIGIFSSLILIGCSAPIKDKTYIAPPPAKTASAIPMHKQVSDKIDSIAKSTEKIDKSVSLQKNAVLEQKVALEDARVQAERIKEKAKAQKLIDEIEAQKLLLALESAENKNFFLEKNVEDLLKEITFQKQEVWFARRDAGVLLTKLTAKEGEADALRVQVEDLGGKLGERDKDVAELKKDNAKKDAKIARNGVYRNWIIGGVSIALLIGLVLLGLRRYGIL